MGWEVLSAFEEKSWKGRCRSFAAFVPVVYRYMTRR